MKENLRIISRCTGLALVIIAALVLVPAAAEAQGEPPPLQHGAGVQKGCLPQNNCNDDADCSDDLFCNGEENCTTDSTVPITADCNAQIQNSDDFGDSLMLLSACDVTKPDAITPEPTDCTGAITFVQDLGPGDCTPDTCVTGDTTCAVGDVLGTVADGFQCVLGPGDSVFLEFGNYVLTDEDLGEGAIPVPNQVTVTFVDNCECEADNVGFPNGCGCDPGQNNQEGSASTNLIDRCDPGTAPCTVDEFDCSTTVCSEEANTGAGGCVAGTADVICDDLIACTSNVCVEVVGTGGGCVFTPDNTLCNDSNLCTDDVCDPVTGCTNIDDVTPTCDDSNLCTDDRCVPTSGLCENIDDVTPTCDDSNLCTDDRCVPTSGLCENLDDVTPTCVPDCEICDPTTGLCIDNPDAPTTCEPGDEICRTPGFWGTHGGDEKEEKSQNITQALLDAYNNANATDLTVCGQVISTTAAGAVTSALEAICVSPKGDSSLQLARQLTAAALNCIITNAAGVPGAECDPLAGLAGDVCAGVSIQAVWEACNDACTARETTGVIDPDGAGPLEPVEFSCINAIDCFNNGFLVNEFGECTGVSSLCHDQDLVNGCFDFAPPGAAGSPRECNEARKNCVSIFGPIPDCVP